MTATVPTLAMSTAFGLVMVASAAVQADDVALAAAGVAAFAVLLGNVIRVLATGAVVVSGAVLVLADAPAMTAAMCGLAAAAYLVLRHAAEVTGATVIGAVGFTAAGLAAVSLPLQLPWVPLVAPVAVFALVVVATRPFWADPETLGS